MPISLGQSIDKQEYSEYDEIASGNDQASMVDKMNSGEYEKVSR